MWAALGIPVFLSECGADARRIMPTRKQMGKGSSPEQAEASALMELMERFAFFHFWQQRPQLRTATWSEAETLFGADLLPVEEMLRSVDETSLAPAAARRVLDCCAWQFYPATASTTAPQSGCPWTGSNCWASSTALRRATRRRSRCCRGSANWWSDTSAAV